MITVEIRQAIRIALRRMEIAKDVRDFHSLNGLKTWLRYAWPQRHTRRKVQLLTGELV